jgi:hypothetical protein
MSFANVGGATLAGAGTGAATAAGIGAILNAIPGYGQVAWGALIGGGAIVGAISGLITGLSTLGVTIDAAQKSTEQNRDNVKELAKAYASGETGTTKEEIIEYIERNGLAVGDAAEKMAEGLLENTEELATFGESLLAMDQATKAYYQAMATNA